MFTRAELVDAIEELNSGKHSIQNCEKLASVYTILDHLYPTADTGYSRDAAPVVGLYGKSDFLKIVSEKRPDEIWPLMDELVEAISVLNPRLYNSFMAKL